MAKKKKSEGPRWNKKGGDAGIIRKKFREGDFNPTHFSPIKLWEADKEFWKYPQKNFSRNTKNIAEEFKRTGQRNRKYSTFLADCCIYYYTHLFAFSF